MYSINEPDDFKKIMDVVIGMIIHEKEILLLRRNSISRNPGVWVLPGGKIRANELPETALLREIIEEAGIELNNVDLQKNKKYWVDDDGKHFTVSIYSVLVTNKFEVILNTEEHDKFAWVPITSLSEYELIDYLHDWIDDIISTKSQ